jgi:hypothetical protein
MSAPDDAAAELDQLLAALVDGELTYVQQQHLAALLRDDPALQEKYCDYLLLDSLLRWEQPEAAAPRPAAAPWRWRLGWRLAGMLAASLLLVVTGYLVNSWQQPGRAIPTSARGPGTDVPVLEPQASGLAVLTRSVRARWDPRCPPLAVGATVPPGPLRLQSGLVQLEFYSGAALVVEGPADLELLATNRLRCRAGKVRATVPPQAHGFTILSATAELVDLGTEFGMEVAPNGATEVHVFAGKVEVHDARPNRSAGSKREVLAGQGLKVEEGGRRTAIPVNARRFASPDEVDNLTTVAVATRHAEWSRASEQLRRDPRLIVYYPFQSRRPGERTLWAENAPEDGSRNGAIIGCEWLSGRWPGKQALEFKRPGDRVRLTVRGEFDALTFMAWVRVDALENRFNGLFLTDGFEIGAPHWQIDRVGNLRLGVCHGHSGTRWQGHNYLSEVVFRPDQLGQWKHLAAVYDAAAGQVTHYVNGEEFDQSELREIVRLSIGNAELGNWGASVSGDSTPVRNLSGRMDEFCLFRVALTPEEILKFYRAGEPIH